MSNGIHFFYLFSPKIIFYAFSSQNKFSICCYFVNNVDVDKLKILSAEIAQTRCKSMAKNVRNNAGSC